VWQAEAIITGTLAGYNSVRFAIGLDTLELPVSLACGDIIALENKERDTIEGLKKRYTMAGSHYFARMKELGLYSTDVAEISEKVERLRMKDIFGQRLV
jgi:hypothetical protein